MPQNDQDIDGNGHGTHCAGTIASRAYGVAKAAHVIAVKVLGTNGSGTMSDVVGGVVWAAQQASAKLKASQEEYAATGKTSHKGSVANMSLGGGKSKALDDAVNRAVDAGMHFAVAAGMSALRSLPFGISRLSSGNDNRDACNYSPAAAEKAVTVGASTLTDERAYFSNHGKCVDVLAPGLNIKSTWIGSDSAVNTISGTSMASPHTAGMLAYLLSLYPSKTFNPDLKAFVPSQMNNERTAANTFATMYSIAHASLPSWAVTFLPSPQVLTSADLAPTGPKTLDPTQLKAALIALSSKDMLAELPAGTPNLLIFNNATA
jgi:cerevisin